MGIKVCKHCGRDEIPSLGEWLAHEMNERGTHRDRVIDWLMDVVCELEQEREPDGEPLD